MLPTKKTLAVRIVQFTVDVAPATLYPLSIDYYRPLCLIDTALLRLWNESSHNNFSVFTLRN